MTEPAADGHRWDIVPRITELLPRLVQQLSAAPVRYQPYTVTDAGDNMWANYTAQRWVRDLAYDARRGWIWMATWGGVLCWVPDRGLCVRHTSAHGLRGTATRTIVLDKAGRIWAGGQAGGLCTLTPLTAEHGPGWRSHPKTQDWVVHRLAPRVTADGGVIAALRDAAGRDVLAEIAGPDAPVDVLDRGLPARAAQALVVREDGIWAGNSWGLHHRLKTGEWRGWMLDGTQVTALASADDGIWVGTRHGLRRVDAADPDTADQDGLPRHEVIALAGAPDTDTVWAATIHEIGRVADGQWRPVDGPPPAGLSALVIEPGTADHVWAATARGLCTVSTPRVEPAFPLGPEDALGNAVQCLATTGGGAVWVGTPQGLQHFDGSEWHAYGSTPAGPGGIRAAVGDVRAVVAGPDGHFWVGSWRSGVGFLDSDVYVPGPKVGGPLLSLTIGADGTMWAAAPDCVYWLPAPDAGWQPLVTPAREHIGSRAIRAICHQIVVRPGGQAVPTLWIGTSAGLFRYRPGLELWDSAEQWPAGHDTQALTESPVEALAVDPFDNRLYVGTGGGLLSERPWRRHSGEPIQALAFGEPMDRTLWVGTATGLQRWYIPDQRPGTVTEQFTAANAGLCADSVTALAVRAIADRREVWVGSPTGVSCYRYPG